MALKDRIRLLRTPAEVDAFLRENPSSAIFKVGACHKTSETFRHVEEKLGPHEELLLGVIRVLEARPASNHVVQLTGITHESPQFILFKDGKPVFDRDNWDITADDLEHALGQYFPAEQPA